MIKYILALLIFSCGATCVFAQTRAKMLHLIIKADTADVYVWANWLFRSDSDKPDRLCIQLPKDACDIKSEDPASTIDIKSAAICLDVNDSAAMTCSYLIRNKNGTSRLPVVLPVPADSVAVFVSGSATCISNPTLKYDSNLTENSRFAKVYSARNVPAGPLDIVITGLPAKPSSMYKAIAALLPLLIIIAAALAVIFGKKNNAMPSRK